MHLPPTLCSDFLTPIPPVKNHAHLPRAHAPVERSSKANCAVDRTQLHGGTRHCEEPEVEVSSPPPTPDIRCNSVPGTRHKSHSLLVPRPSSSPWRGHLNHRGAAGPPSLQKPWRLAAPSPCALAAHLAPPEPSFRLLLPTELFRSQLHSRGGLIH